MLILGLTKTTLLDYPGHVAATVFTGGCNFRCPFCHNGQMVMNPASMEKIPEEEVLAFLVKRKNILDGVCITGGEPTIHADLPEFLKKIKDLGYEIKLDTNGTHPDMVEKLAGEKLIDHIAMDIKNVWEKYPETAGCDPTLTENVKRCAELIKRLGISYEFRTTVVRELHSEEDIAGMCRIAGDTGKYYLQSYEESENVIEKRFSAYTAEEFEKMLDKLKDGRPNLRGIE
ncbi:MAG: anaerobic ribonucleoside-triphosphate reductase activating protein [Lachnospiraceae bacterium]|nr:anaerobic ribonucleoside-triphosphate reductase activating protein [Lachnospiraceae bacterium]